MVFVRRRDAGWFRALMSLCVQFVWGQCVACQLKNCRHSHCFSAFWMPAPICSLTPQACETSSQVLSFGFFTWPHGFMTGCDLKVLGAFVRGLCWCSVFGDILSFSMSFCSTIGAVKQKVTRHEPLGITDHLQWQWSHDWDRFKDETCSVKEAESKIQK